MNLFGSGETLKPTIEVVPVKREGRLPLDVPFEIIQNGLADHGDSLLYFPGYGESRKSTSDLLKGAEAMGIGATAMKLHFYDIPPALGHTREEAILYAVQNAYPELIAGVFGSRSNKSTANSLGAGTLGLTIREAPELIGDVAIVNGLGLTNIDGQIEPSTELFFKRYLGAMIKSILEKGAPRATASVIREVMRDLTNGSFVPQLRLANEHLDVAPDYLEHARNHKVHVYSGSRDSLFPKTDADRRKAQWLQKYPSPYNDESTFYGPRDNYTVEGVPGLRHQDAGLEDTKKQIFEAMRVLVK